MKHYFSLLALFVGLSISQVGHAAVTVDKTVHYPYPRWNGLPICHALTVSHDAKFVYCTVPKTGSRSVISLLGRHFSLAVNESRDTAVSFRRYRNYFKFAFVRNPWDRIVSVYLNKVRTSYRGFPQCKQMSFDEFVEWLGRQDVNQVDPHARPQVRQFPPELMDYVGRMETFEEDIHVICERLGLTDYEIPYNNATQHEHYSHYYNDRTREIIGRLYRMDIEAFGYTFESE